MFKRDYLLIIAHSKSKLLPYFTNSLLNIHLSFIHLLAPMRLTRINYMTMSLEIPIEPCGHFNGYTTEDSDCPTPSMICCSWVLYRSTAGRKSCYVVMTSLTLPFPELSISQHFLLPLHFFLSPILALAVISILFRSKEKMNYHFSSET